MKLAKIYISESQVHAGKGLSQQVAAYLDGYFGKGIEIVYPLFPWSERSKQEMLACNVLIIIPPIEGDYNENVAVGRGQFDIAHQFYEHWLENDDPDYRVLIVNNINNIDTEASAYTGIQTESINSPINYKKEYGWLETDRSQRSLEDFLSELDIERPDANETIESSVDEDAKEFAVGTYVVYINTTLVLLNVKVGDIATVISHNNGNFNLSNGDNGIEFHSAYSSKLKWFATEAKAKEYVRQRYGIKSSPEKLFDVGCYAVYISDVGSHKCGEISRVISNNSSNDSFTLENGDGGIDKMSMYAERNLKCFFTLKEALKFSGQYYVSVDQPLKPGDAEFIRKALKPKPRFHLACIKLIR